MAKNSIRTFACLFIALFVCLCFVGAAPARSSACVSCLSVSLPHSQSLRSTRAASSTRSLPSGNALSATRLYVGGMPFGVKFMTEGVLVVGFCDVREGNASHNPSLDAGLRQGDVILKVNGKAISGAAELNEIMEASAGHTLTLECLRDGKAYSTTLTPVFSSTEHRYKSGLYVRDSGAGIGTVTFILPETLSFAGLGHGICDADTGELVPIQRGSVVGVTINGVVKGLVGAPGEVRGYFSAGKVGSLLGNTSCGVYGVLASLPKDTPSTTLPIGTKGELKNGKAQIRCTLDESGPCRYDVEISDIHRDATGNKCFTVKVTDPALLEKSGGIVQGMSGSPIIQNGKLVGAVTHVLINDPTTGYGIFIENMLNQMGDLAK